MPKRFFLPPFLFSVLIARAAPSADVNVSSLTWSECVIAAKESNPQYIAAYKSFEASKANLKQSYNGFMPSVGLSSSYSESDSSTEGEWSASGNASMDLVNFQSSADIHSAAAQKRQARASWDATSAQVRFNLRQAFANLLFAQEQVAVSLKIEELRKKNADLVSLKYESGRESKGNMLRSKAELRDAQAGVAQAQRNLAVSQQELNRWLGRDPFAAVSVKGQLGLTPDPVKPDIGAVAQTHPEVKVSQASLSVSQARLKSARSSLWPSLTANYTRSFSDDHYFPGNPSWSASGIVRYPLFGGGLTSTFYGVSSAKRGVEESQENLRATEYRVRTDLETAWAAMADATDQIEVQNQFLVAARQRNSEAMVRYSSGLMSYENWEDVVTELVNFERSAIRAERDAMVAEASWNSALGKILEEQ